MDRTLAVGMDTVNGMTNEELIRTIDWRISSGRIMGSVLLALVGADSIADLTDEQRQRLERLLEF